MESRFPFFSFSSIIDQKACQQMNTVYICSLCLPENVVVGVVVLVGSLTVEMSEEKPLRRKVNKKSTSTQVHFWSTRHACVRINLRQNVSTIRAGNRHNASCFSSSACINNKTTGTTRQRSVQAYSLNAKSTAQWFNYNHAIQTRSDRCFFLVALPPFVIHSCSTIMEFDEEHCDVCHGLSYTVDNPIVLCQHRGCLDGRHRFCWADNKPPSLSTIQRMQHRCYLHGTVRTAAFRSARKRTVERAAAAMADQPRHNLPPPHSSSLSTSQQQLQVNQTDSTSGQLTHMYTQLVMQFTFDD